MIETMPVQGSSAERIAGFAAELTTEPLPAEVLATARLLLLDTVGCALAAVGESAYDGLRALAIEQGGAPQARVLGSDPMVPAPSAALANGSLAHALDFDDIHPASSAHTSAVVIPAALAAAQANDRSGEELLAAIVLGTEVVARIGSIVPAGLHERGFHVTSVAGVFGAAAAAAALAGADPATTVAALGIAGSLASGIFAYLEDATETKPLHAGWAAQAGVQAAAFAAVGIEGPASVIEGRYGILDTFLRGELPSADARRAAVAAAFEDLGSGWRTLEVTPKAYPCCAFMHPWLAAAERALGDESGRGAEVVGLRAAVPVEVAVRLVEPRQRTDSPSNGYDAKFSLPYSLAALVRRGRLDLAAFAPAAIADEETLALARRVEVSDFPQHDWSSAPRGAVELELDDGRLLRAELEGQPAALTALDGQVAVEAKYRANAEPTLGADRARALGEAIAGLGGEAPIDLLGELLGAAR
ncbi:MAG: MmgE/PrpD family protein [Actinobacteria bacterium]|nr:MmgE/PrpD family protein [Actinomycetota bacterium]